MKILSRSRVELVALYYSLIVSRAFFDGLFLV